MKVTVALLSETTSTFGTTFASVKYFFWYASRTFAAASARSASPYINPSLRPDSFATFDSLKKSQPLTTSGGAYRNLRLTRNVTSTPPTTSLAEAEMSSNSPDDLSAFTSRVTTTGS